MQGTNSGQGNQNGQKQNALSWSQPPQNAGGVAKPISQVSTPPVQSKISSPAPAAKNNAPMAAKPMKANTQSKGGGRTAGIFAAGVIVGLIIGWGWFSLRTDSSKVATTASTNSTAAAAPTATGASATPGASANSTGTTGMTDMDMGASGSAASSGALTVGSQSAGSSVSVSSVSVSAPTWVVIFDNKNGTPGNALGAAMFFPGEKSGTVDLLRATVPGQSYLAGQYVDNGDHIFSKQSDTMVKDITGAQMLLQFSVK